jgi:alkylhydroperoxidase family enzyme
MLDYAIKITRTPVDCDEADIEKLRSLGFSLDDVYDIITTASVYNYNNSVAEAAGYIPDRANRGLFR